MKQSKNGNKELESNTSWIRSKWTRKLSQQMLVK